MITEFFIDCFFSVANSFFEIMPDITWSVDTSVWQYAKDVFDMVAYLLPLDTILTIAGLIIKIAILRLVISFILFIKSFIPFMG